MVLNRPSRREADARLAKLRRQVSLQVFTIRYEDDACRQSRQAAEELAEATSRLSVEIHDVLESVDLVRKHRVDAFPALVAVAKDCPDIRVYGVPLAYGLLVLLDVLSFEGVPSDARPDLVSACDSLVLSNPISKVDLVCSRRDISAVEAGAAFCRSAQAAWNSAGGPRPAFSIRFVEDFPAEAVIAGGRLPAIVVDGQARLTWPFTDSDIIRVLG